MRYANDLYGQIHAQRYTYKGHDLELTLGGRGAWQLQRVPITLLADLAWSGRYNRDFIALTGPVHQYGFEHNLSVRIGASWTQASGRSGPGDGPASPPARP